MGMTFMATSTSKKQTTRQKVQNYRDRMRARGLRPIQIWVPDTRTARFAQEAHNQSLVIAQSEHEGADQAFIDAISAAGTDKA